MFLFPNGNEKMRVCQWLSCVLVLYNKNTFTMSATRWPRQKLAGIQLTQRGHEDKFQKQSLCVRFYTAPSRERDCAGFTPESLPLQRLSNDHSVWDNEPVYWGSPLRHWHPQGQQLHLHSGEGISQPEGSNQCSEKFSHPVKSFAGSLSRTWM